ncbi:DUF4386 family protein [Nocardia gipuzkoensis]
MGQRQTVFTAGVIGWIVLVLADAAVAVTLYHLLRPVAPSLAAIIAALRRPIPRCSARA